jgi:hypothetical protein
MSEGAEESDHTLDVMDLVTKKRGFLPRTKYLEGTALISRLLLAG